MAGFALTPLRRSLLSACAGFVVYGGWALWVNLADSMGMGLRAGLVQGSYSFLLTMTMTLAIEGLMRRLEAHAWRRTFTVLLISAGSFATAYSIHFINGTPKILLTILPGFFLGALYTLSYTYVYTRASVSEKGVGPDHTLEGNAHHKSTAGGDIA